MDSTPHSSGLATRLVLAFAAIYLLWGSTYLAIRFGVETIPPFFLAGARHLTAGILLYAWLRARGAAAPRREHWKSALVVGGLLLLGGNGLVTWAEQRVPSGLAALIVSSVPIWMTLFETARSRRRPRGSLIAGLALGIGGIALLVAPSGPGGRGHVDPLGAVVLLCAALCWSAGSLYSRHAALPAATLTATAMEMIAGGALLAIAGLATGERARLHLSAISTRSAVSLAYLVVFGSLLGFTAYVWLLKVSTPARVSTYAYVNPIVAVVLGAILGGEIVTVRVVVAAAVIVGAVALIIRSGIRSSPSAAERRLAERAPSRAAAGGKA